MPALIYLIRHATPDWSRTDIRYDVPPGPPLTAQGEAEATKLGEFLHTAGVRKIYASPLERTQRTAALAAQAGSIPVIEALELAEWKRGESETEILARFTPFWTNAWAESTDGGPIAFVTHGGPIRMLLQHLKLDQAEIDFYRRQFDRDNPVPPAGAWAVSQPAGAGSWQLELAFTPQPHQRYVPQIVYV